jgi:hypothetical protein
VPGWRFAAVRFIAAVASSCRCVASTKPRKSGTSNLEDGSRRGKPRSAVSTRGRRVTATRASLVPPTRLSPSHDSSSGWARPAPTLPCPLCAAFLGCYNKADASPDYTSAPIRTAVGQLEAAPLLRCARDFPELFSCPVTGRLDDPDGSRTPLTIL